MYAAFRDGKNWIKQKTIKAYIQCIHMSGITCMYVIISHVCDYISSLEIICCVATFYRMCLKIRNAKISNKKPITLTFCKNHSLCVFIFYSNKKNKVSPIIWFLSVVFTQRFYCNSQTINNGNTRMTISTMCKYISHLTHFWYDLHLSHNEICLLLM